MNTESTQTVVIEREMPHSAQKIWRALTEGTLLAEWLMANDFKPVVGHRFTFRATPNAHWNGITDCEVLLVEPHKKLSYSWGSSGSEAANGLKTIVSWTLTPKGSGVLLRMEQSGFGSGHEANYRGAQYGWQKFMAALEQVVAKLP